MKNSILFPVFLASCLSVLGCSKEESSSEVSVSAGEELYTKNCKVCHSQGINGAPILGNKKMWGSRIPQGKDTLVSHAVNGFGLMPPKGGKANLSDEDIAQVVDFMMSKVVD